MRRDLIISMAASLGGQNGGEAEKTAFNVSWWWTLGQVEWPIAILTQQRRCGIGGAAIAAARASVSAKSKLKNSISSVRVLYSGDRPLQWVCE